MLGRQGLIGAIVAWWIPASGSAQTVSLEGVWRIAEVAVYGPEPSVNRNPQPSLYLFSRTHFSIMAVPGDQPRPQFRGPELSDAEKIAAFDTFIAASGTYEFRDSTLTIHPLVARNPTMVGGYYSYQCSASSSVFWLVDRTTTVPPIETRVKLVRVE